MSRIRHLQDELEGMQNILYRLSHLTGDNTGLKETVKRRITTIQRSINATLEARRNQQAQKREEIPQLVLPDESGKHGTAPQ